MTKQLGKSIAPLCWLATLALTTSAARSQTGACCSPVTGCSIVTQSACQNSSSCGVYQGDGTTCAGGCPVQAPRGACCNPQLGGCVISPQCDCINLGSPGSQWMGANTACDSCPVGACCLYHGTTLQCSLMGQASCTSLGGVYNGGGTSCVAGACPSTCYSNCDHSTQTPFLNVQDFTCFLQRFAAGVPYANCDNSTQAPVLNVQDFTCYLQRFATGCSAP
jgi:hypothetical protein